MKNRAHNLLLPAVFAAACSAAVAQANCDAVTNALEKAQAQPRLAQYSVDSREHYYTGPACAGRMLPVDGAFRSKFGCDHLGILLTSHGEELDHEPWDWCRTGIGCRG